MAALESLEVSSPPQNDHYNTTVMRADFDLDGDGIRDAIIGQAQADVEALNGGGIFVFLSSEAGEGLYPKMPSQTFASDQRRAEVGRAFDLADLNGDGRLDWSTARARTARSITARSISIMASREDSRRARRRSVRG